ncbi:MAG: GTPase Era [Patescibacteria group bacterium]
MPKSGFAVLIGRSNVGKSTLLNALVGSKIAITTPKPQTTRLPVQGIITDPRGQVVFVDTPGIMQKARDALTKRLLQYAKNSLNDVDVILYVVDPTRAIGNEEHQSLHLIETLNKPKILVINKIDAYKKPYMSSYQALADKFDEVIEVSALRGTNLKALVNMIFERLQEGEFYYPEFQISSMPQEQWVAELIREKLFLRLREEVPYSTHVEVDEMRSRPDGSLFIAARILTNAERYKSMIIGAGGRGVKEIGQSVRKELEGIGDRKVFLELHVETDPHWVERL